MLRGRLTNKNIRIPTKKKWGPPHFVSKKPEKSLELPEMVRKLTRIFFNYFEFQSLGKSQAEH